MIVLKLEDDGVTLRFNASRIHPIANIHSYEHIEQMKWHIGDRWVTTSRIHNGFNNFLSISRR